MSDDQINALAEVLNDIKQCIDHCRIDGLAKDCLDVSYKRFLREFGWRTPQTDSQPPSSDNALKSK